MRSELWHVEEGGGIKPAESRKASKQGRIGKGELELFTARGSRSGRRTYCGYEWNNVEESVVCVVVAGRVFS
jgi:hypothetical protein